MNELLEQMKLRDSNHAAKMEEVSQSLEKCKQEMNDLKAAAKETVEDLLHHHAEELVNMAETH